MHSAVACVVFIGKELRDDFKTELWQSSAVGRRCQDSSHLSPSPIKEYTCLRKSGKVPNQIISLCLHRWILILRYELAKEPVIEVLITRWTKKAMTISRNSLPKPTPSTCTQSFKQPP